jgi:hypothetical protein
MSNNQETPASMSEPRSTATTSQSITLTTNDRGGVTYGIEDSLAAISEVQYIASFETGKDRIDMLKALKNLGVNTLNFNLSDPSELRNPGDAFVNYTPHNNQSQIIVKILHTKTLLAVTVTGVVRLGDIAGSGWS